MRIWQFIKKFICRHLPVLRPNIDILQFGGRCVPNWLNKFGGQCVPNLAMRHNILYNWRLQLRINLIQPPELPEPAFSQSFRIQPQLQFLQQLLTVCSPVLSVLLELHYIISDQPVSCSQRKIDGVCRLCLQCMLYRVNMTY